MAFEYNQDVQNVKRDELLQRVRSLPDTVDYIKRQIESGQAARLRLQWATIATRGLEEVRQVQALLDRYKSEGIITPEEYDQISAVASPLRSWYESFIAEAQRPTFGEEFIRNLGMFFSEIAGGVKRVVLLPIKAVEVVEKTTEAMGAAASAMGKLATDVGAGVGGLFGQLSTIVWVLVAIVAVVFILPILV